MADIRPSKDDIQAIFKKLRAISTNKVCFDCNAKSPSWATVTYGVFICIDCSAVHRSLGVHLTFVRSTQLDTNWTWIQLRQMQLGGNANASVFFRQHNCVTTDAQQKYTSRAAQLYKDKLLQTAQNALRIHGYDLHVEGTHDKPEETQKDVDFFEEHSSFSSFQSDLVVEGNKNAVKETHASAEESLSGKGPSVDLISQPQATDRKSIIGGRKPAAKKTGLGGKKAGLGAQRVQTNFADLEREAEMHDQRKEERKVEEKKAITEEEKEEQMVSMRLAYQDLSLEQQKQEERIKKSDPKKAQQMERLGMGFAVKTGFSHSALSDMQTIEQESPIKKSSKPKYDNEDNDDFFDDYAFPKTLDDLRAMNRNHKYQETSISGFRNYNDDIQSMMSNPQKVSSLLESSSSSGSYERDRKSHGREEKSSPFPSSKSWYDEVSQKNRARRDPIPASVGGDAQKKFGNAKAISSDQFFGQSNDNNYERSANLSRFDGSTSISSSDYFQDGVAAGRNFGQGITNSISAPDLDEVKESVRQGVTKVAGRISSLANGVINSIQDRYGY